MPSFIGGYSGFNWLAAIFILFPLITPTIWLSMSDKHKNRGLARLSKLSLLLAYLSLALTLLIFIGYVVGGSGELALLVLSWYTPVALVLMLIVVLAARVISPNHDSPTSERNTP